MGEGGGEMRGKERERVGGEGGREKESVCVCVCAHICLCSVCTGAKKDPALYALHCTALIAHVSLF